MIVNEKIFATIIKNLESVSSNTFDESNIKGLLIDLRDCGISADSFLKEICHFIAHPTERDKGICHKEIDIQYFKFKYASFEDKKGIPFPIKEPTRKERELVLSAIETTSERRMGEYNLSKKQAKNVLKSSYKKSKDGKYVFHGPSFFDGFHNVLQCVMREIYVNNIFTQNDVIQELKNVVANTCHDNKRDEKKYLQSIEKRQNGIMLCVFSLLQGSKFRLHDDEIAESRMSISNINEVSKSGASPETLNYNGLFPVPWSENKISIPIITTDIKVTEYFDDSVLDLNTGVFSLFEVICDDSNNLVVRKEN